jgi:hypothetical protein
MKLDEENRTELQNRKMWPMLRDISKQVKWQVNGALTFMDEYDWKDVLTAALKKHNRIALGTDGGFVFLGMRTHRMKKSEIIDLIELMYAFGSEREVKWTEDGL